MISNFETIRQAIANLKINKTRSFLTMLGIVIGVSSVILLVSIGAGLQNYITDQFEDLGTNTLFVIPGSMNFGNSDESGGVPGAGMATPKFNKNHLKKLRAGVKSAKFVMPYIETSAKLSYKTNNHLTQLCGVNTDYLEVGNQSVSSGQFFTFSQEESSKKVIVLGQKAAEETFGEEDPVGKKVTVSGQKYTVLGLLEEKGSFGNVNMDDQAYAPWTTVMDQNEMETIMSFYLVAKNKDVIEDVKAEAKKVLLEDLDKEDFSIMDTKSLLNTISSVLSVLTLALGGIAAISLLVGGIGIMNIMLVSVSERTREIGLRKAIGATPQAIRNQFLTEAVVFSLTGGIIGILLGVGASLIIGQFINTAVTLWSVLLSFGVSSLVGIVFGVTPAAKAAKLDPIKALRYE